MSLRSITFANDKNNMAFLLYIPNPRLVKNLSNRFCCLYLHTSAGHVVWVGNCTLLSCLIQLRLRASGSLCRILSRKKCVSLGSVELSSIATSNTRYLLEVQCRDSGSPLQIAATHATVRVDTFIPDNVAIRLESTLSFFFLSYYVCSNISFVQLTLFSIFSVFPPCSTYFSVCMPMHVSLGAWLFVRVDVIRWSVYFCAGSACPSVVAASWLNSPPSCPTCRRWSETSSPTPWSACGASRSARAQPPPHHPQGDGACWLISELPLLFPQLSSNSILLWVYLVIMKKKSPYQTCKVLTRLTTLSPSSKPAIQLMNLLPHSWFMALSLQIRMKGQQ